jgi:hypothetical protein
MAVCIEPAMMSLFMRVKTLGKTSAPQFFRGSYSMALLVEPSALAVPDNAQSEMGVPRCTVRRPRFDTARREQTCERHLSRAA